MTYNELLQQAAVYKPLALLERTFPVHYRRGVRTLGYVVFVIAIVLYIFAPTVGDTGLVHSISLIGLYVSIIALLVSWLCEYMYRSYMFSEESSHAVSPLVALIVLPRTTLFGRQYDVLATLFEQSIIESAHLRMGLSDDDAHSFLATRSGNGQVAQSAVGGQINYETLVFPTEIVGCAEFVAALIKADEQYAAFIASYGLTIKEYVALIRCVESDYTSEKFSFRWLPQNMLRVPSIGRDWAYGKINLLEQYGTIISGLGSIDGIDAGSIVPDPADYTISEHIVSILSRERESHVVLVGDTEESAEQMFLLVARTITEGRAGKALAFKRIIKINPLPLIDVCKEKTALETLLLQLLAEASHAGDIILVFSSFASFVENAHHIGADVIGSMASYLQSNTVSVVTLATTLDYHRSLETNTEFTKYIEKVEVPTRDAIGLTSFLWHQARKIEWKYKHLYFSYQALKTITTGAARYFSGSAEDKALDILSQLASDADARRGSFVNRKGSIIIIGEQDVSRQVATMTGVPQGTLSQEESTSLLSLETDLHKRVIGQDTAISVIAKSLRRSRAGIASERRPMGSFLFLGPTGVGKTETAKALADIFFKGENNMIRLDMSEYKTDDALSRLIGNASTAGVLPTWVREKPYGVLLLDEFEKTNKDVQDLFLQILDEGIFTDGAGVKVNARNMIIIATSNAGSDLIFEWAKGTTTADGHPVVVSAAIPATKKDELISTIVSRGIFKPELINRFDAVVMYQPLNKIELRSVATTMLQKLADRLKDKGVGIAITDELLDFLIARGSDPVFGARAMNRMIQDTVEAKIADSIIRGHVKRGETIKLDVNQLAALASSV